MKRFILFILSVLSITPFLYSQNIIAYWHLDEASGNYVADVSGYNNHGTADPAAIIVQGLFGNARMVPQSTSIFGVTIPNSTSLNLTGNSPFTLEAFVKIDGYENNGVGFLQKVGNYGLGLGSYGSAGYLQLFIWPNTTTPFVLQTNDQIPLNQWIHVAGTWDGSVAKLYVDYQLVKSQNYSTPMSGSTNPVWLAHSGTTLQPTTESILDEVRITATALDPTEFLQFPTDVENSDYIHPDEYILKQNFPNPFNPSTTIRFQIPELSFVTLKVYDILGNEISTLINEEKYSGSYEFKFNATDLPSGIYFYQLQAGDFVQTKKMTLIK